MWLRDKNAFVNLKQATKVQASHYANDLTFVEVYLSDGTKHMIYKGDPEGADKLLDRIDVAIREQFRVLDLR